MAEEARHLAQSSDERQRRVDAVWGEVAATTVDELGGDFGGAVRGELEALLEAVRGHEFGHVVAVVVLHLLVERFDLEDVALVGLGELDGRAAGEHEAVVVVEVGLNAWLR